MKAPVDSAGRPVTRDCEVWIADKRAPDGGRWQGVFALYEAYGRWTLRTGGGVVKYADRAVTRPRAAA